MIFREYIISMQEAEIITDYILEVIVEIVMHFRTVGYCSLVGTEKQLITAGWKFISKR
jgi:hypothetical protein